MTSASVTAMVWLLRRRGRWLAGRAIGRRGFPLRRVGRIPAWIGRTLSPTEFSSAVTAITSAFGDPTRREIYLFAREHADGVTAAEVAEQFDLHPNVARHHLDKLAAGGYLEVGVGRAGGAGAGRPSKRYRATGHGDQLDLPVRHDDVLVTLLGRALDAAAPRRRPRPWPRRSASSTAG